MSINIASAPMVVGKQSQSAADRRKYFQLSPNGALRRAVNSSGQLHGIFDPGGLSVHNSKAYHSEYAEGLASISATGIGGALLSTAGIAGIASSSRGVGFEFGKTAISSIKGYLGSYYATNGWRDAKSAGWDAFRDVSIRGNLEVDKFAYNFLPIPSGTAKDFLKNGLDPLIGFTLNKKAEGGLELDLYNRTKLINKYDVSRGGFEAALDLGSEGLDSAFGGKYKGFRDSMKALIEITFDKSMQVAEESEPSPLINIDQ